MMRWWFDGSRGRQRTLEVGTDNVPLLNLFVNDDNNNPHSSQCALLDKHLPLRGFNADTRSAQSGTGAQGHMLSLIRRRIRLCREGVSGRGLSWGIWNF